MVKRKIKRQLFTYKAILERQYGTARMQLQRGFQTRAGLALYQPGESGNRLLAELLRSGEPVMVSRYGLIELDAFAAIRYGAHSQKLSNATASLHINAGFFPCDIALLPRFAEIYARSMREIDCLAAFNFRHGRFSLERRVFDEHSPRAHLIDIKSLDSFRYDSPWTSTLRGKRVLVVYPFEKSIRSQYQKRHLLFSGREVLPAFESLEIVKAVQSIAGADSGFRDWFEALDYMIREIEKRDFDVALIGAGAYGMPLAAHVKRMGKQAVHLGGTTQILFGVMGSRWENNLQGLANQYWVRPSIEETPENFARVEGGCYW